MRTSLTRAVAGAAIAATAVLTAVGTAGAADAATKAPTSLTLTEHAAVIKLGQTDLLTGTLKSGSKALSGKVVALDVAVKGKWVFVDDHFTGPLGHVFFTVKPAVTTAYKLFFTGTTSYRPSSSNAVTVKVVLPVKKATILTIGEKHTKIKPGQSDTVFGTLKTTGKAPLAGQIVWLYTLVNGKWVNPSGHVTGKFGGVSFKVTPAATTKYELRFLGTANYRATHSGVVTVVVS
jgi:hypothetical protein